MSKCFNEKTFCIGPYSEVRINPDGSLNFCHYADGTNIGADDNIKKITVDEYFQTSKTITNTRLTLEQGGSVSRCHRCYTEESRGLISFRHRRNIQAAIFPKEDFEQSLKESAFSQFNAGSSKPKFYHVSFNNVCNMACLMCGPANSTLLAKTLRQAEIINAGNYYTDWTQGPAWGKFLDHLLSNDQIVCLHIMGGEPFFQQKFIEMLRFLVANKHTDYHFSVVTNGSVYDPEIVKLLEQFRSVQIEISIEGTGLQNNYIRYPSQTQEILENIQSFLNHRNSNFDVVIRTVPQILSVIDYKLLIEFCLKNRVVIDSNILHHPEFLIPSLLPEHIKAKTIDELQTLAESLGESRQWSIRDINLRNADRINDSIVQNINLVINQMQLNLADPDALKNRLVNYCARLDKVRDIDVRNFVPMLADFFTDLGYDKLRY